MIISIIVAMARNRVIGKNNRLPWHLPADLKHFKETTMGHPIIMGRKTYESIGRPLPGRTNIVVTRNPEFRAEGCTVVHSLEEALRAAEEAEEVFVIGGATLYREALPIANRIYLTLVEADIEGDTLFPEIDSDSWEEVHCETHPSDERNPYAYSFIELKRKAKAAPPAGK